MARHRLKRHINGWLNFDKPLGMSSAQAVAKLRRLFATRKVGHAGTLDPLASGVLPVAFGEATKTIRFMQAACKTYMLDIAWGQATTTDDGEGAIIAESARRPTVAEIRAALPDFIGAIEQVPPQFSAIRQGGQRAYQLARAGVDVVLPPRTVQIDAIEVLDMPDTPDTRLRVVCGKGVYMRALARDLAVRLGTYGHVRRLRRLQVGVFDEKSIITLEKLCALGHSAPDLTALDACLMPIATALDDIPAWVVGADAARALRQGQAIAFSVLSPLYDAEMTAETDFRVHDADGLVAICRSHKDAVLPIRVFNVPI